MSNFLLKTYIKINSFFDKGSEEKAIQIKVLNLLNGENVLSVKLDNNVVTTMIILSKKEYSLEELDVINTELNKKLKPLKEELSNYEYKFKYVGIDFNDIEY